MQKNNKWKGNKMITKVQEDEICFDCYSDEIVINPNETNKTEYWCNNCNDITSTILKSEIED